MHEKRTLLEKHSQRLQKDDFRFLKTLKEKHIDALLSATIGCLFILIGIAPYEAISRIHIPNWLFKFIKSDAIFFEQDGLIMTQMAKYGFMGKTDIVCIDNTFTLTHSQFLYYVEYVNKFFESSTKTYKTHSMYSLFEVLRNYIACAIDLRMSCTRFTILHLLCFGSSSEINGKTTVNNGGNVNIPLERRIAILQLLLKTPHALANVENGLNLQSFGGETAIYLACNWGCFEVVQLLICCGADVNKQESNFGYTPLHIIALNLKRSDVSNHNDTNVYYNILVLLSNNGGDANITDYSGCSVYDILVDNVDLKQILNQNSYARNSPLHHRLQHWMAEGSSIGIAIENVIVDQQNNVCDNVDNSGKRSTLQTLIQYIEKNPVEVSKKDHLGRYPLHVAIESNIISEDIYKVLLSIYSEAACVCVSSWGDVCAFVYAAKKWDAAIHGNNNGNESLSCSRDNILNILSLLLSYTLPVNVITGEVVHDSSKHMYLWTSSLIENLSPIIERVLNKYSKYINILTSICDTHGRKAIDIATPTCKQLLLSKLYFLGRYKFRNISTPVHETGTCVVHIAEDFGDMLQSLSSSSNASTYDNNNYNSDNSTNTNKTVALKFMRNEDEFLRECTTRKEMNLSEEYIIAMLSAHNSVSDKDYYKDLSSLSYQNIYPYLIVMPACDRNLSSILSHENIAGKNWDEIVRIGRSIAQALDHLHQNGIVHGDVKRK